MAYTALYRKFRPLRFDEMVGQEHITGTLKKQIIANRIGHAYLFNGGRGTGKTSAAKILSRAVNCLNLKGGEPCNECEICKGILSGAITDVVEMDAASNNSVEDIRNIREEVNFLPTRAKYRVYIIDEVHMLSTNAFNALLKTLEEPPEHVKFILATTEPQSLPATILSRCQRFDFKRISNEDIVKRLKIICEKSNIEITDDALKIISILSEGAMRDAISILERCFGEEKGLIDEDYIRELVGIPKTTQIFEIVKGILTNNCEEVIKNINIIIEEGKDIDNFLWEIIKYLKDLLVYKTTNNLEIYNNQEKEQMQDLIKITNKENLLQIIYDLSKLANDMKWSSQKSIVFEVGIINACINKTDEINEKKQTKEIKNVEIKKQNTIQLNMEGPKEIKKPEENRDIKPETNINTEIKNDKKDNNKAIVNGETLPYWDKVISILKQSGRMGIYVNLIGSKAVQVNDLVVEVNIGNKNAFAKEILEKHENKAEIEKIVSKEAGKPMNVKFVSETGNKKTDNSLNAIENMVNNSDISFNIIDE